MSASVRTLGNTASIKGGLPIGQADLVAAPCHQWRKPAFTEFEKEFNHKSREPSQDLSTALLILGGPIVATSVLAQSDDGHGLVMPGGDGLPWMWLPILLGFAAVGLVAWIVNQKRK